MRLETYQTEEETLTPGSELDTKRGRSSAVALMKGVKSADPTLKESSKERIALLLDRDLEGRPLLSNVGTRVKKRRNEQLRARKRTEQVLQKV